MTSTDPLADVPDVHAGDTTATWVYVGRRQFGTSPVAYCFAEVGDAFAVEGTLHTFARQVVPASVGQMFTVTVAADGRIWTGGDKAPVPGVRHPDKAQVAEWAAKDLAVEQARARKSMLTKAAKVDPLDDLLQPLADVAARLTRAERRALAARVLEVLYV